MDDANPMPALRVNTTAAAKAQQAWTLRVAGVPWRKIADHVGFSDDAGAIRAVRNYAGTLPQADRDSSRELWRARLEALWSRAWTDVLEQRPGSVRAATAVAQRAAQLDSLDQPTAVAFYSPSDAVYQATLHRMLELDRQDRGGRQLGVEPDIFADSEDDVEYVELVEEDDA